MVILEELSAYLIACGITFVAFVAVFRFLSWREKRNKNKKGRQEDDL